MVLRGVFFLQKFSTKMWYAFVMSHEFNILFSLKYIMLLVLYVSLKDKAIWTEKYETFSEVSLIIFSILIYWIHVL
jgi:hypothetical protein